MFCHGDAINILGIMELNPVILNIIHRDTIKTNRRQLDVAEIGKCLNGMAEEESVANHALPQSIGKATHPLLLLHKNDLMPHCPNLREWRVLRLSPCACDQ